MELVNQSSIATLYQLGKLSSEGISRYQRGLSLTEESFRDSGAATYAYQHGHLTGEGVRAYQHGHLGAEDRWFGFGNQGGSR